MCSGKAITGVLLKKKARTKKELKRDGTKTQQFFSSVIENL